MKQPVLIVIIILQMTLVAYKDDKIIKAIVVRDCTGTYMQIDGKDYQVCNEDKINAFANGTTVKIKYKKISSCELSEKKKIICYMYHPSEGWIEITKIK